jgi:hypothetical protein
MAIGLKAEYHANFTRHFLGILSTTFHHHQWKNQVCAKNLSKYLLALGLVNSNPGFVNENPPVLMGGQKVLMGIRNCVNGRSKSVNGD